MEIKVFSAGKSRTAEISEIEGLLKSETEVFWVDILEATDVEARILHDIFKFHPLAIEDTRNHRQRPKIEEYEGYLFLIVNSISVIDRVDVSVQKTADATYHDLVFREIDLFVGRNYVVSVHNDHETVIEEAKRRFSNLGASYSLTTSYLLYTLL